jgi:hypothetical protein
MLETVDAFSEEQYENTYQETSPGICFNGKQMQFWKT